MSGKIKTGLVLVIGLLLLVGGVLMAPKVLDPYAKGIPEGWSVITGNPDDWSWKDGKIVGHAELGQSMLVSSEEFKDVTLSANASSTNREASFVVRARDADNCYLVIFVPSNTGWRRGSGWVDLVKREGGKETVLSSYKGRVMSTLGYTARITTIAKGPWIEVKLNDVTVIRVKDLTYTSGFIGLRIFGKPPQFCDASYSYLKFE